MEAQNVKDLMEAYASVYTQPEEQEVLTEDPVQDYRDMKRDKENAAGMRGSELSHSTKSYGGSAKTTSKPRSREFAHKEEVEIDLFDCILEYLVAEGYADTNENALVIMANMSEDWRESIVETVMGSQYRSNPIGNAIKTGAGALKSVLSNPSVSGAIRTGSQMLQKNITPSNTSTSTPTSQYSTRPGDGKPYKDGPLWGGPETPVKKPTTPMQRKPQGSQGAPMRDEPLW
jgi:hypothetical protein